MRQISFLIALFSFLSANVYNVDITPSLSNEKGSGIRILDQKYLSYSQIKGIKFSELSDLAFDKKTNRLYMISDEGKLFTFEAQLSDKVDKLLLLDAVLVRKKSGKKFKKYRRDTEGLTIGSK